MTVVFCVPNTPLFVTSTDCGVQMICPSLSTLPLFTLPATLAVSVIVGVSYPVTLGVKISFVTACVILFLSVYEPNFR